MNFRERLKNLVLANKISIRGTQNSFLNYGLLNKTNVFVEGSYNSILIKKKRSFENAVIKIRGDNNNVIFEEGGYHRGTFIYIVGNRLTLRIGKDTCTYSGDISVGGDSVNLDIGQNCLFAKEVVVRTSDSHKIYANDDSLINVPKSVSIGDHVWIGYRSIILKGVHIGNETVITAGAVVTKSFGPNSLIGGVPAKLLKEGIYWKR